MKNKETIIGIAAFASGIGLCMLLRQGVDFSPVDLLKHASHRVGITFWPLVALSLWSIYAGVFSEKLQAVTLEYIGTTAQRVGLLGTVIGLVTATMQIGAKMAGGAAGAVGAALPSVGEALLSTALGFLIALLCDLIAYFRFSCESTVEPVSTETAVVASPGE